MMSEHVLVTGGAGYIGSILVPMLLDACYNVTVVDDLRYNNAHALRGVYGHPNFNFVQHDFRTFPVSGYDHVVHLAAIVGETACKNHPVDAIDINQHGAIDIAKVCQAVGVRTFIFASTCSIYGKMEIPTTEEYPIPLADESYPVNPLSLYAETKVAAEQGILLLGDHNFRVAVLRFATAYGTSPCMRFDTMVNEFAMHAVVEGKLVIYNPQAWRPICHVRNLATAVLTAIQMGHMAGVYNVGGHNLRKSDLAGILRDHMGTEIVVEQNDADKRDYMVNFSRIGQYSPIDPILLPSTGMLEVVQAIQDGLYDNPMSEEYRHV